MSLRLHIERTVDNRHPDTRIAHLEAENAVLRERIVALEKQLGERPSRTGRAA